MRTNNNDIPAGEQAFLLRELQNLLEKQIELADQGSIKDIEAMASQCEPLVAKIIAAGLLEKPKFKSRCSQLKRLYQDLCLRLSAQKDDAATKLTRIRRGRKTLLAYRNNIR
jgi:hypothetical protein